MSKGNFKISVGKYIKAVFSGVITRQDFEEKIENLFKANEENKQKPIILILNNCIFQFAVLDVILFVNNNKVMNKVSSKVTPLAVVANDYKTNEIIELFIISLQNNGYTDVRGFDSIDDAIKFIETK